MSDDLRSERRHPNDKPEDHRTPFERDVDRVRFASAFRRLGQITQVARPDEPRLLHNRLTHSLEVAQIARRIAQYLHRVYAVPESVASADVVEAAALAHDLGHPPFGHIAEEELNAFAADSDAMPVGFNGNAQSFRIITTLAQRRKSMPGLNLTRATLNAVLKYPWRSDTSRAADEKKWGAYTSEANDFAFARSGYAPGDETRSLEAQIMDWADDVAYAVHDLDDFFRMGLIPLHRLADEQSAEREQLEGHLAHLRWEANPSVSDVLREVVLTFPLSTAFNETRIHRAGLRRFTSRLVGVLVDAVSIDDDQHTLLPTPQALDQVALLKQLTWHYVIDRPALATQQHGQRRIIRALLDDLMSDALDVGQPAGRRYLLFSVPFRELLEETGDDDQLRKRIVIDYVASMTEAQVLDTFQRLTGHHPGSVLDA